MLSSSRMTLLQRMTEERARQRESLRLSVIAQLRHELAETIPGERAIVFGSLIKPGRFSEFSDVDLALEREPGAMSIFQLTSILAERLGRRVDVVLLPECRFAERILREGEAWMPQG